MAIRDLQKDSTIRRVLRYFGITPARIAEQAGTNSHTVNRVLDLGRFESVQFRNAIKVRRAVRELLEQTDYQGDVQLLWLEYDDPDLLETLLERRQAQEGSHYSGLPKELVEGHH